MPAYLAETTKTLTLIEHLVIEKQELNVKRAWEVGDGDIEIAAIWDAVHMSPLGHSLIAEEIGRQVVSTHEPKGAGDGGP